MQVNYIRIFGLVKKFDREGHQFSKKVDLNLTQSYHTLQGAVRGVQQPSYSHKSTQKSISKMLVGGMMGSMMGCAAYHTPHHTLFRPSLPANSSSYSFLWSSFSQNFIILPIIPPKIEFHSFSINVDEFRQLTMNSGIRRLVRPEHTPRQRRVSIFNTLNGRTMIFQRGFTIFVMIS